MNFNKIDMRTYPRKEHFEFFSNQNNCTYSVTSKINVQNIVKFAKHNNLKFYALMICIISKAVNKFPEFKMAVNEKGELGFYDEISPSYLIFHDDDKTFSCINTEFSDNLNKFYNEIIKDMEFYQNKKGYILKPAKPNQFSISSFPWLDYSALDLNVPYVKNYYSPIITWGKFDENYILPFTVQIDHAVADGYHVSMLFNEIQNLCNKFLIYF